MQDGITDGERARLRRWVAAGRAPWWKRALWGRDVFEPHLRTWRVLIAMQWAFMVALPLLGFWSDAAARGLAVPAIVVGVAAIVTRWRAVARAERERDGRQG
jgi:CDP-diglyceride synthetase